MTLLQVSKAYGVLSSIGNMILPGKLAKAIYDNQKMLADHVEFLSAEERKLIAAYGATSENGDSFHVDGDDKKNKEFITRILEIQQFDVEVNPVYIDEDELLSRIELAPNQISMIEYIFAAAGSDQSEGGKEN